MVNQVRSELWLSGTLRAVNLIFAVMNRPSNFNSVFLEMALSFCWQKKWIKRGYASENW